MSARRSLDRLRELGPTQDAKLMAQNLEPACDRFLESAAKGQPRSRWVAPASVAAFAAAAAVLFFVLFPSPRALSFAVGAAQGQVGAWIAATPEAPLEVRFSDGTALVLDANARARVVAADVHGARVLLESGTLTAAVTHTGKSAWRFNVGPFDVLVTGTRFDLKWDPSKEELRLVLKEGSVSVSGPLLGQPRAVVSGETLEVFCQQRRFELTSGQRAVVEPPPAPTPEAPATSAAAASADDGAASSASADVPPRRPAWRDLAGENRYKEAMSAAEAEGFDSLVAKGSAADLLMLADVARFSGKAARATEALTAARSRFAGSGEAAKAAFHLGRLAFDQRRSYADAERWFSVYLGEQPGGAFAQEALGRLIECRESMGQTTAAREAARRYLTSYPAGPHAEHAKSLLAGE